MRLCIFRAVWKKGKIVFTIFTFWREFAKENGGYHIYFILLLICSGTSLLLEYESCTSQFIIPPVQAFAANVGKFWCYWQYLICKLRGGAREYWEKNQSVIDPKILAHVSLSNIYIFEIRNKIRLELKVFMFYVWKK